jgi:HlyD family secretion protein
MRKARLLVVLVAIGAIAAGAWFGLRHGSVGDHWLGYADADYVKIGPTQQGRLTMLSVARGDTIAAGATLFTQDDVNDRAARDQAQAELAQASEKLADLKASGREAEIVQARADIQDRQAAYDRVARDLARNEAIVGSGAATRQSVDQLRADARSAQARVESAKARLDLIADSSGRSHAIAAQNAAVAAARAGLAAAQWRLDERRVAAPAGGLIADTYAQPGETLAAGAPVVSLLPPENILVRFFVPETELARLHPGDLVRVACDSCPRDLQAQISFVASAPEYTPPVIYSQGSRGSLVFLIEARPVRDQRFVLKPGQPVNVSPVAPRATQ